MPYIKDVKQLGGKDISDLKRFIYKCEELNDKLYCGGCHGEYAKEIVEKDFHGSITKDKVKNSFRNYIKTHVQEVIPLEYKDIIELSIIIHLYEDPHYVITFIIDFNKYNTGKGKSTESTSDDSTKTYK
jgi:dsRNA-specific ribonuclease